MHANYRFRIQPLFAGEDPYFRLTVGMAGERDFELIPIHCSAFAQLGDFGEYHSSPVDVQLELTALLEWLAERAAASPEGAGN